MGLANAFNPLSETGLLLCLNPFLRIPSFFLHKYNTPQRGEGT